MLILTILVNFPHNNYYTQTYTPNRARVNFHKGPVHKECMHAKTVNDYNQQIDACSFLLDAIFLMHFLPPRSNISGIREENSVPVTFNIIVPQNYWLWDDKTTMSLRFAHPKLGSWNTDVGTFKCSKYVVFTSYLIKHTGQVFIVMAIKKY